MIERANHPNRLRSGLAGAMLVAGAMAVCAPGVAQAGSPGQGESKAETSANVIRLQTDYARQFPTDEPVGSIVIGNPVVADVSVRDDSYLFLHGRSPGRTNLLIYDKEGNQIGDYLLVVSSSQEYVQLQRGAAERTHYTCAPRCEQVLSGDTSPDALGARAGALQTLFGAIDERSDRSAANAADNETVDE